VGSSFWLHCTGDGHSVRSRFRTRRRSIRATQGIPDCGEGFVGNLNLTSDLSSISTYVGKRIDLLLGLDVLCQDSFEIDYESRRIRFGDLPTPKNSVPFERNVPRLVVESHIDGYFVNLLVDSGSDSLAVFTDRLPKKSFPPALEQIGHDGGGPVWFTQITPLQVLVGRNELAGQRIFLLPPRLEAQGYDGTLAPVALGAPRIYFDFKRMRFGWDEIEQPESRSLWTSVAAEK
jgi:hypothetical protein